MKLDFDSIHITNFKNMTGEVSLDFRGVGGGLNFVRGRNLIEPRLGSNGAGKTTLWDALTWVLYGKTASGLRSPDIQPWRPARGGTGVTLELRLDGEPHMLSRGTHAINKIEWDDEPVTDEDVEDAIGLTYETFVNTVMLGQGQPLFYDLPPREKLELFSSVLRLDRWDARSDAAKRAADTIAANIATAESQRAVREQMLAEVEESRKRMRSSADEWEAQRAKEEKERNARLADFNKLLASISKVIDEADLAYDSAMTELRHLDNERAQMEQYRNDARDRLADLRSEANGLQRELGIKQEQRIKFGTSGRCPTCDQPIKGTRLDKHREELDTAIANLKKALVHLNDKGAKKTLEDLELQLSEASRKRDEFQTKARQARDILDARQPDQAEMHAKIDALKRAKLDGETEVNPFNKELDRLKRRVVVLQGEIVLTDKDLTIKRRRHARLTHWVKGFKDVRLHIVEEVLQELELCSNAMLDEMGLIGWRIAYAIERETKTGSTQRGLYVTIFSPSLERNVRWENWSGGESQRLRLLGALALSETLLNHAGIEPGMEVLDEPTQHLSLQGVRDLVGFLAARARTLSRQVWFIDHRAVDSDRFNAVLTVTRDHDGASISLDNEVANAGAINDRPKRNGTGIRPAQDARSGQGTKLAGRHTRTTR
jgi:DNA repair exonuclease SbcCD ATPase subunit